MNYDLNNSYFSNGFKKRRILVTGHTGFKGSWLCEWLLKLGAKVSGYSVGIPTSPSLFELNRLSERLNHDLRGDIRSVVSLQAAFKMVEPEIVFHLAAQPIVAQSYADPLDSFSVNAIGTANVLECLRIAKHLVSAVIVTSDKAYENVEWDYGYRETDRLGGHDPYSASKACAEIIFSSYYRSFLAHAGVKVATARAGNVIGGGDFAADRVVPDTFRAWLHDQTAILRKPASTRPWQHVLEPLSGYLVLATELQRLPKLAGESFNFGPDSSVVQSVDELVRALSKHWKGAKVDSGVEPTRFAFHEAGLLKLCCDKALKKLHWHSILTFQESADFTADWFNRVYKQKQDPTATTSDQIDQYCALAAKRNISWANN